MRLRERVNGVRIPGLWAVYTNKYIHNKYGLYFYYEKTFIKNYINYSKNTRTITVYIFLGIYIFTDFTH